MMTDTCVHVGCVKVQRARRLCEQHYQQLKRSGLGQLERKQPRKANGLELDCQLGRNRSCVDCGVQPWGGGRRCLPCFQVRCKARAAEMSRAHQPHTCSRHDPSVACYVGHGCRCYACKEAKSDDAADRRAAA